MFNYSRSHASFKPRKVVGANSRVDFNTYRILYAGPDPADESRFLIKKVVQVAPHTYCYEESTVTKTDTGPQVHQTLYKLGELDMREAVGIEERTLRQKFRPFSNFIGFSVFYKNLEGKKWKSHWTMVENFLQKPEEQRWADWYRDYRDRANIANYLYNRWV